MTTPEEPGSSSSTGWPTDGGGTPAPVSPPPDPTPTVPAADPAAPAAAHPAAPASDSAVASGSASVEVAPVLGRNDDVEEATDQPEAGPDPEPAPESVPDPEPAAEPEPVDAPEPEPIDAVAPAYSTAPLDPTPVASGPGSVDLAPVPGRNDPDEQGDESGEIPPPPPAPRDPSPWRSPLVLALVLMTVLMAVATGVVWYQVHRHDQIEKARQSALETSRDAARVLFSYDYRTLDKDFSAGKAITTGKFRSQYSDTTSKVVTPVATQKKAVVKAEVVSAGVVRATPDTVVTIVYVNQVTTSSLQSGPKVDLSRVRMTVKHVGGRWLVANVEAL